MSSYRPVAAVSWEQLLLLLGALRRVSINSCIAGITAWARLTARQRKKNKLETKEDTAATMSLLRGAAPFLLLLPPAHYHSVSLPPEACTLAPAAWQPLVSLSQLLCCLIHNSAPPHPSTSPATQG